jgi:hypothetical protein
MNAGPEEAPDLPEPHRDPTEADPAPAPGSVDDAPEVDGETAMPGDPHLVDLVADVLASAYEALNVETS